MIGLCCANQRVGSKIISRMIIEWEATTGQRRRKFDLDVICPTLPYPTLPAPAPEHQQRVWNHLNCPSWREQFVPRQGQSVLWRLRQLRTGLDTPSTQENSRPEGGTHKTAEKEPQGQHDLLLPPGYWGQSSVLEAAICQKLMKTLAPCLPCGIPVLWSFSGQ